MIFCLWRPAFTGLVLLVWTVASAYLLPGVDQHVECYDPEPGIPRLAFADCREASRDFVKDHPDTSYELVHREPRSEDELQCPFHQMHRGCVLELDYDERLYDHNTPLVHAVEVDRSGLKLARACTRIANPYDGGEIHPVDPEGGVILRFIHPAILEGTHQEAIPMYSAFQNLTYVRR